MEKIINQLGSNDLEWNESYYLTFFDRLNGIGGISRIGFKPNKPEGMTFFFLFFPDRRAGGYFLTKKIKDYSKGIKVGGMKHNLFNNKEISFEFKGKMIFVDDSERLPDVRNNPKLISDVTEVIMSLNFKPISEVYEYSEFMTEKSLRIGKKAGDKHWEQIALISGKIIVDDKIYKLDNVMGQRDHTYGIRDWTGVGNWLYYVVWFNKSLAINPAAIVTIDGEVSTGGFLFKDGKNIPLKSIKIIDQQFRDDDIFPISSELEIIDFNDDKHSLKAKVDHIIPVPFENKDGKKSILIQSFGSFELDGIHSGYGTFETLRKVI